jgi:hypothetical protein
VRRGALVEVDELVDLAAAEPVAVLRQSLEAIPGVAVCEHERVDVHQVNTSQAGVAFAVWRRW